MPDHSYGMTQTFIKTSIAAVLAACALLFGLADALQPHDASAHASVTSPTSAAIQYHRTDAIPPANTPVADPLVAAVLGGDGLYTTVQADQVHLAADRVCEGFTAGVPLVVMEPELVQEFGLDGATAHEFVKVAHDIQCPLA
jgi:hypothetical protein